MKKRARSVLSEVPLFRSCDPKDLVRLERLVDHSSAEAGESIVVEGASGREFFVLLSGSAEVTRAGTAVRSLGPGEFFGELALLVDHTRSATVTAATDVELLVIDRPVFKAALLDMPTLAVAVLEELARRLVDVEQQS